ncbi:MAG: tyrosine-type recombinase/integrase [Oscillospiraceae bacterium]
MDGYTSTGKRHMVGFCGETKEDVLLALERFRAGQGQNIKVSADMDFAAWAEQWYIDYQSQVEASTYCGYQYTLRLLTKSLATAKLSEILPIHINKMLDKLTRQGYSLSQVRKCRTMMIQIFDAAENNRLIDRSPARHAKAIRDRRTAFEAGENKRDAFTEAEVNLLLAGLDDDLLGNSIRLMLFTGLRVQELLALMAEDIAEDGSLIIVNKAVKTVDGKPILGVPKSRQSNRDIPVPEGFQQYAVFLRQQGRGGLIWSSSGGSSVYGVGSFRRRFNSAIGRIEGVRKLTPHCCRHTYITMLQAGGVAIDVIASLAGHADIEITQQYLHPSRKTLAEAAGVLGLRAPESAVHCL